MAISRFHSWIFLELILAASSLHVAFSEEQQVYSFKGKVTATTPKGDLGAAGLSVSLSRPVALNKPKLITATDEQGQFNFSNLERGQYLLEVFQRLTLLYRQLVNVPSATDQNIKLAPDLDAFVDQIDLNDGQSRLKPVNTLAFDDHYPTPNVVSALLQRLEAESPNPLSVQGEINALIILARRTRDPWSPDQTSRAKAVLTRLNSNKDLTGGQKWAIKELTDALARETTTAAGSIPPAATVGMKGYCYLGKFADNTWKIQHVKFAANHLPAKGDVGIITYPLYVRDQASTDGAAVGIAQIGQKVRIEQLTKKDPDAYWAQVLITE
jgi:hypothetical protein